METTKYPIVLFENLEMYQQATESFLITTQSSFEKTSRLCNELLPGENFELRDFINGFMVHGREYFVLRMHKSLKNKAKSDSIYSVLLTDDKINEIISQKVAVLDELASIKTELDRYIESSCKRLNYVNGFYSLNDLEVTNCTNLKLSDEAIERVGALFVSTINDEVEKEVIDNITQFEIAWDNLKDSLKTVGRIDNFMERDTLILLFGTLQDEKLKFKADNSMIRWLFENYR